MLAIKNCLLLGLTLIGSSYCFQSIHFKQQKTCQVNNQRACSVSDFAKPYLKHVAGGGDISCYKFNLNIKILNTDFNYWYLKLEAMNNRTSSWTPEDFFNAFFGPGVIRTLIDWPAFRIVIKRRLVFKAREYEFQTNYFFNILKTFFNEEETPKGFSWFSSILRCVNTQTLTINFNPLSSFVTKLRRNLDVLQFPFEFLLNPEGKYVWYIGSGIKIFPLDNDIRNSVIQYYFYNTPYPSYQANLFKRIPVVLTLEHVHDRKIKDNDQLIRTQLWSLMVLPYPFGWADLFVRLSRETEDETISNDPEHPTVFEVDFMVSLPGLVKILISQPFAIYAAD